MFGNQIQILFLMFNNSNEDVKEKGIPFSETLGETYLIIWLLSTILLYCSMNLSYRADAALASLDHVDPLMALNLPPHYISSRQKRKQSQRLLKYFYAYNSAMPSRDGMSKIRG